MIERLVATLRELSRAGALDLGDPATRRLVADCADALRLELDCMQQALAPAEREALHALHEVIEHPVGRERELQEAAQRARMAIAGTR